MSLVDSVPQNCARVFDGMCIVQQLPSGLEIFRCLSDFILARITNKPSSNIFFTTDQYWDASIKLCERNRRATSGSIRVIASRRDHKLSKQFKKYISVGVNKQELIDFLLDEWSTHPKYHQLIRNKTIYFSTRKDALKLNVIGEDTQCQPVTELSSNQEEVDTKVFLAVKLAQEIGYTDAVIYTVDSDVAILLMYYSRRLAVNLFMQLGTGSNVRIVDVGNTDWQLELVEALPSLLVILGCDPVSAFNGIGKAKWLSTLEEREGYMNAMRLLGENLEVTESLFAIIEIMVCYL